MGNVSLGGDWQTGGCAVVVVLGLTGLLLVAMFGLRAVIA